jgi:membrane protein
MVVHLEGIMGRDAARAIQDVVVRSRPSEAGIVPTIMGAITMVVGATTVFVQLQSSLNNIWGVEASTRKSGFVAFVNARLASLAIVVAVGFVLLVSLLVSVALRAAISYANNWVAVGSWTLTASELVISFVVFTLLFALIFQVLPDVHIAWRDVWAGAAITATLFIIGRYLIALYLAYAAPGSAFGAAGSLVLILMWVYYSSLILLFGAALTRARTLAAGREVVPCREAVRVRQRPPQDESPPSPCI